MSLGVSCASLGASSPQDLLDQADKALYAAKHGGRNRVVRFDRLGLESPLKCVQGSVEHESSTAADIARPGRVTNASDPPYDVPLSVMDVITRGIAISETCAELLSNTVHLVPRGHGAPAEIPKSEEAK
jgi:hypothetical protein